MFYLKILHYLNKLLKYTYIIILLKIFRYLNTMPITLANLMLNEKEGLSENDEESELGSLSILLFLLLLFTYFTLA